MKELTIEEKAKAYDKALERAKTSFESANGMILKKWLVNIFPELKESEDEKIMKAIIELVKQSDEILNKKNQESMLAWLEKQGEQKQWSEEDESIYTRCIGILGMCYIGELPTKVEEELKWLKSLKDRCFPQPKQEWSNPEKLMLDRAISSCEQYGNIIAANWLKSLRPQKQWKPSEEQMEDLKEAADNYPNPDVTDSLYEIYRNLKAL